VPITIASYFFAIEDTSARVTVIYLRALTDG
jgi:hypothetical protein